MPKSSGKIITVGITGASGAAYAQSVLRLLDADPRVQRVFLVASEAGMRLLATELGIVPTDPKNSRRFSPTPQQKKSNISPTKTSAPASRPAAPSWTPWS